jgi:DNA mismatch repair ATPase MutS
MAHSEAVAEARALLRKAPDVERLLSRMRANGVEKEKAAVMYENVGKQQVEVFLRTLEGFKTTIKALWGLREVAFKSSLLCELLGHSVAEVAADADADDRAGVSEQTPSAILVLLDEFHSAFDHAQALREGVILPQPGVVPAFDQAFADHKQCEQRLSQYLTEQKAKFSDGKVQYFPRMR